MPRASAPLFALIAALLSVPSVARAHIGFRSSDPAAGSHMATPPRRITLRFTAQPQLGFTRVSVVGPAGELALDSIVPDGDRAFSARVPRVLAAGAYTVRWRTASSDGHVIHGEFAFSVMATPGAVSPAAAGPPPRDTMTHVAAPAAHEDHVQYQWMRWFEFVALVSMLGVLGFRHAVLPPLASRGVATAEASDRAHRLGRRALVLYLLASAWRLYAESVAVHGAIHALDAPMLWRMLTSTTWGAGWLLGVAGAIVLAVGWRVSKRSVTMGTPLALVAGLALVVAPALSGHAAVQRPFALGVAADAMHVLAAGGWTGGLLVMLVAGIPAMKRVAGDVHSSIAALVNSFHPLALFCVVLLVLSGITSAWLRLGDVGALWGTGYGRTLLIKLGLFALVVALGAFNATRARRRLGSEAASRRLMITAAIELALVGMVLAATAALVVTPFPAELP